MVNHHYVQGYEAFCDFMSKLDSKGELIHIIFSGTKLPNGDSWCSDCVEVAPVVEESYKFVPENSHIVHVEVGDRPTWKDPNCTFRKDPNTRLNVLPSIIRWKSHQRLEGDQCGNIDLLELLFTDS